MQNIKDLAASSAKTWGEIAQAIDDNFKGTTDPQESELKWLRAIDKNGDPMLISAEDHAKVVGELIGNVTSEKNGLVSKDYYLQKMQEIYIISDEIIKIKSINNVGIDIDCVSNSFGSARFYLLKSNDVGYKCLRLFGYCEPYNGAAIDNTKFYHDAEGNFYVQCPPSTGIIIRAFACDVLSYAFEKVEIDTSTLTEIEQTII